jgi:stearoyl-CoA desaturase (delta-9 desaturase)
MRLFCFCPIKTLSSNNQHSHIGLLHLFIYQHPIMFMLLFVVIHWYASLFFQSIFHHRYAAHGQFSMNKFWEKCFFIGAFITQGSSYISAYAYGLMHRLHHAHTDEAGDPHSPHNDPNPFALMWSTRNRYNELYKGFREIPQKYHKNLPEWHAFDKIVHHGLFRLVWLAIYITLYFYLATAWWHWLFLPITVAMGSFQGVVVNWWAHKFGYENHSMNNTSKNILPVDFLFWGEAYHNNHHKHPHKINNAVKWFEWDMGYQSMRLLRFARVIQF